MSMAAENKMLPGQRGLHWPTLIVALAIMLVVTIYPPLLADGKGGADHALASLLMTAMSIGFVRGVGFVPGRQPWRMLFSGFTCLLALILALVWWLVNSPAI